MSSVANKTNINELKNQSFFYFSQGLAFRKQRVKVVSCILIKKRKSQSKIGLKPDISSTEINKSDRCFKNRFGHIGREGRKRVRKVDDKVRIVEDFQSSVLKTVLNVFGFSPLI